MFLDEPFFLPVFAFLFLAFLFYFNKRALLGRAVSLLLSYGVNNHTPEL
jgi:hypothetical protein